MWGSGLDTRFHDRVRAAGSGCTKESGDLVSGLVAATGWQETLFLEVVTENRLGHAARSRDLNWEGHLHGKEQDYRL